MKRKEKIACLDLAYLIKINLYGKFHHKNGEFVSSVEIDDIVQNIVDYVKYEAKYNLAITKKEVCELTLGNLQGVLKAVKVS